LSGWMLITYFNTVHPKFRKKFSFLHAPNSITHSAKSFCLFRCEPQTKLSISPRENLNYILETELEILRCGGGSGPAVQPLMV
jgi:hypothetical protein